MPSIIHQGKALQLYEIVECRYFNYYKGKDTQVGEGETLLTS